MRNFERPSDCRDDENVALNELQANINATVGPDERNRLMGQTQEPIDGDAVATWLCSPTGTTESQARVTGS